MKGSVVIATKQVKQGQLTHSAISYFNYQLTRWRYPTQIHFNSSVPVRPLILIPLLHAAGYNDGPPHAAFHLTASLRARCWQELNKAVVRC